MFFYGIFTRASTNYLDSDEQHISCGRLGLSPEYKIKEKAEKGDGSQTEGVCSTKSKVGDKIIAKLSDHSNFV